MTSKAIEPVPTPDTVTGTDASQKKESLDEYASRIAVRMAISAGALVALLVILLNMDRSSIPMMDDMRSFGTIGFLSMLPITFVVAVVTFVLGSVAWNERVELDRQRRWSAPALPIAIAYTLVVGFAIIAALTLAEQAFQYLHLITLQSALLTGAAAAAITFWVANSVMRVRTGNLLQLVVIIVTAGIYLTATRIDDPLWWQVSFSYLGKMESNAKMLFNATFVFTGILLLTWMGYFMSDYNILVRHNVASKKFARWVRYGFAWLAIAIMLVGIFKSNYTPFSSLMHNLSAYSLALVFALFMISCRWTVPGFPKEFFAASWTLVALLLGVLVSAGLGRMNTVGLELTGFALGMIWLSLFVGNTETNSENLEPKAFPK